LIEKSEDTDFVNPYTYAQYSSTAVVGDGIRSTAVALVAKHEGAILQNCTTNTLAD
jgi:hypothetical protein